MTVLTLDPREAIQPRFVEGIVNKKLEQQLDFIDIFPVVPTEDTSFMYYEDITNAGQDILNGTMGVPLDLTELSELTRIEVSPITMKMGTLNRFGYALEFSKRDLRTKPFIDELMRAYDRAAFGIAKKMNDDTITGIQGVSNDITEVSGAKVWSDPDANPPLDLLSFAEAMDLETTAYELSDIYLHKTNYYEFLKYMQNIDRTWGIDPTGNQAKVLPPVNGITVHNTHSTQMAEGSYIGFDRRYPAATIYKYVDPDFSTNPLDSRINVDRYQKQEYPKNQVIEIFVEQGIALKLPNAVSYKSTGI